MAWDDFCFAWLARMLIKSKAEVGKEDVVQCMVVGVSRDMLISDDPGGYREEFGLWTTKH